jgi:hypothetical protein
MSDIWRITDRRRHACRYKERPTPINREQVPNVEVSMHHKRLMMSIDSFAQLSIGARKLANFLSSLTPTASTHRAWLESIL